MESGLSALVQLLERMPELYADSWDAIVLYRLDGTIVAGNKRARSLVRDSDLTGSHFFAHMSPDERMRAQAEFSAVVRTGLPREAETVFVLPDGRRLDVEGRLLPATVDGAMVGVFGIARDVTRRKKFEREMHDSQQRLLSLFENHPDSISMLDAEGRYVAANRAAEVTSGYTIEQYRGKTAGELFDPEHAERFSFLIDAVREGRTIFYETSIVRPNGKTMAIEGATIPVRVDGVLQGAFNVVKDVSEKRHYEATLVRDSERMRHLYQIASSAGTTPRQRIQRALRDGMVQLGADWAFVARIRDDVVTIEHGVGDNPDFVAGQTRPLAQSMVRHVGMTEPLVISDLQEPPWNHDVSHQYQDWVGFTGVPLHVGNQFYGVAGFTTKARPLLLEGNDRDYIAAIGALIASAIERV